MYLYALFVRIIYIDVYIDISNEILNTLDRLNELEVHTTISLYILAKIFKSLYISNIVSV